MLYFAIYNNNKSVENIIGFFIQLQTVLQEDGEELYRKHVAEWQTIHHQAGMDIEGNLHLVSAK